MISSAIEYNASGMYIFIRLPELPRLPIAISLSPSFFIRNFWKLRLWKHWANFIQSWLIALIGERQFKLWNTWPLPVLGLRRGAKTIEINAIFKKKLLLYTWTSSSEHVGMIVMIFELSTKIVKLIFSSAPGYLANKLST